MPTISQLINYCRKYLKLEHTRVVKEGMLKGLPGVKNHLIMLILIYHSLFEHRAQNKWFDSRAEIFQELKSKYKEMIFEGETEQNLEEIMLDLFLNDILTEYTDNSLRMEFQRYTQFGSNKN